MTIDDLARSAQLPVRTIREYHTMRLLPPPERRGRVGIYGAEHVERLNLIGRLQRRGYSLAGIRDLLQAWDAGNGLTAVLGVEAGQATLDETPHRLTSSELRGRFPALAEHLDELCAAGLAERSDGEFLVRSPALLALIADGAAGGVPLADMLELVATLRREISSVASALADIIADRLILPQVQAGQKPSELVPLLQRSRILLMQGAASTLTEQLGAALLRRADRADQTGSTGQIDSTGQTGSTGQAGGTDGQALRTVLEQIRIGAIADAAGNIRRR
jgi:DNA-binding transcriptional MerR regulator